MFATCRHSRCHQTLKRYSGNLVNTGVLLYSSVPAFLANLESIHARYPLSTSDVKKVRLAVVQTTGKQPESEQQSQYRMSPEAEQLLDTLIGLRILSEPRVPAFLERLGFLGEILSRYVGREQDPRWLRIRMTTKRITKWVEGE